MVFASAREALSFFINGCWMGFKPAKAFTVLIFSERKAERFFCSVASRVSLCLSASLETDSFNEE